MNIDQFIGKIVRIIFFGIVIILFADSFGMALITPILLFIAALTVLGQGMFNAPVFWAIGWAATSTFSWLFMVLFLRDILSDESTIGRSLILFP